ncbi:MAG: hypothetical protein NW226_12425 [Microscillaceae bacterium]|nr:hypothetical protein [Microscillaceae bacterium]
METLHSFTLATHVNQTNPTLTSKLCTRISMFIFMMLCLLIVESSFAQQWNPAAATVNDPIWRNGNVGIGINAPLRPLHLRGSNTVLQIDRDTKDPGFGVTRFSPGFGQVWKSFFFYTEGNAPNDGRFVIADWGTNVSGPSAPRFVIGNTGNIGLGGELNPNYPLDINGTSTVGIQYDGPNAANAYSGAYMNGGLPFYGFKRNNQILGWNYMSANNNWVVYNQGDRLSVTPTGNVGIGTNTPAEKLHVIGRGLFGNTLVGTWAVSSTYALFGNNALDHSTTSVNYALLQQDNGRTWLNSPLEIRFMINNANQMTLANNGNFGIGTTSPAYKLEVTGSGTTGVQYNGPAGGFAGYYANGGLPFYGYKQGGTINAYHYLDASENWRLWLNGAERFIIENDGDVTISGFTLKHEGADFILGTNDGRSIGTKPLQRALAHWTGDQLVMNFGGDFEGGVFVDGPALITRVLTIIGGADIAEPFEISENTEIEAMPGTLMVIDEENPGKLKSSTTEYDTKVAGIVSGAQGVNPGLVLNQEEKLGGGTNIALTGRVYVKANTSNGVIKPGDLLTTSNIAGEAMKVTDFDRARGAVLGKAMTALEGDSGYVLVLVTLQ